MISLAHLLLLLTEQHRVLCIACNVAKLLYVRMLHLEVFEYALFGSWKTLAFYFSVPEFPENAVEISVKPCLEPL